MLKEFKNQLLTDFPDLKNKTIYLAISGGKDSMVLSHLLLRADINHILLHCNFQLRGKESDGDEDFIKDYAQTNNLQLHVKLFDTYKKSEKLGKNIQETARILRYNWFSTFAENNNTLILTAHHLDDSVETFFINLLRGTGIKGISGIPKFNPPYYRPLLSFSVEQIFKYIDEHNIDYREDSSNREDKYTRNRIRHELIPNILEIEPSFKEKMKPFFDEINDVKIHFSKLKDDFFKDNSESEGPGSATKLSLTEVRKQEQTLLRFLFSDFNIRRSNFLEFLDFLKASTGAQFHTNTHDFLIDRDQLLITLKQRSNQKINISVEEIPFSAQTLSGSINIQVNTVDQFQKKLNPIQLDLNKVTFPLKIRNWQQGDRITPLGMKGTKLISDVLIDNKVSKIDKARVIVIIDDNDNLIAVPGYAVSELVKIDSTSKSILEISYSNSQLTTHNS
ncbi:MAG: tRNA lysidine(34) synthetase TilS [Crocinitomicaceae bacterium]|nr:tRNA lysidine(34) synthetase TilS [Crocinitomicaceae bacterium]